MKVYEFLTEYHSLDLLDRVETIYTDDLEQATDIVVEQIVASGNVEFMLRNDTRQQDIQELVTRCGDINIVISSEDTIKVVAPDHLDFNTICKLVDQDSINTLTTLCDYDINDSLIQAYQKRINDNAYEYINL